MRPRILLTNDDGIHSPGLHAAVRAARALGDVTVAAPARQQTAMGRSYQGDQEASVVAVPYDIDGAPVRAFSLEATPALVMRHALQVLYPEGLPDLVISGINYGENIGTTLTASGTVGAALEAAAQGIPSMAVSMQTDSGSFHHYSDEDWSAAGHFLALFAARLLESAMPFDLDLLKVDVPLDATLDTPWRLCRQSRLRHVTMVLDAPRPDSRIGESRLIWGVDGRPPEEGSDVHALLVDKVVAVVPISLDATSRAPFAMIQAALEATAQARP
jgi:5'-nucleotidase